MVREVAILTFSYAPETGPAAMRIRGIAAAMQGRGWQVNVVTPAPNYPTGIVSAGYGETLFDERREEGVRITRIRVRSLRHNAFVVRFFAELYFALLAAYWLLRTRPSLVLSSTPFMALGPLGFLLAKVKRAKFVWDIRDLIWLYPRATGKRTFGIDWILEAAMLLTARGADLLTATTRSQLEYFAARVRLSNRSLLIQNGVSDEQISAFGSIDSVEGNEADSISILYAGAIGHPQQLEVLVGVAHALPGERFVIAGDGPLRAKLEEVALERDVSNIECIGYLRREELLGVYQRASVLVAHLGAAGVFATAQPSKIWEYMLVGKPIVFGGQGEAAFAIKAAVAGIVVPSGDAAAMANAISVLRADRELAARYGKNGRQYVLENLRHEQVLQPLLTRIETMFTK